MKKLFVIAFAGAMLSACSHGPKKDEPLGFKAGMTVEDVRSRVQLGDEEPSLFYKDETTAEASKIDTDVAQPRTHYLFFFKEGKLRKISTNYSGKENIEKVEAYLNQVANCKRVDEEDKYGDRSYYCYYYNPDKSSQQLATFVKVKSPIKNDAPWLGIEYTFMQ